jgi:hypothetical protein
VTAHQRGGDVLGPDEVLVHIGLPKTATTSLQSCLAASRSVLAGHGVLYPGSKNEHVIASFAPMRWFDSPRVEADATREWASVTEEVAAHRGRVVYSAENLCVADADAVRRVVHGLGGDRVRIVVTVRALHLTLPSFWQHEVRAGLSTPFDEWAAAMAEGPAAGDEPDPFWLVYDIAAVVERWADVVGAERVAVVIVDPARPAGVFADVEALIGLPPGLLDPGLSTRSNRSLTAAEAEVIRRLNERLADVDFGHNDQLNGRFVRPDAIRNLTEGRSPRADEPRLTVPAEVMAKLRPVAERFIRQLRGSGAVIIGDLAALVPPSVAPGDVHRPRPAETVPMESAVLLMERLLRSDAGPESSVRTAADQPLPVPAGDGAPLSRRRRLVRRLIPVRVRRAVVNVRRR